MRRCFAYGVVCVLLLMGLGRQLGAQGPAATSGAGDAAPRPAQGTVAAAGDAAAKPVSIGGNSAAANSAAVSSATSSLKAADENALLLQRIAKLPPLSDAGIDVAQQAAATREHLNAVLRFYRSAMVPIQKVGEPSDVLYAEQSQSEATQIAVLAFQAARNEAALVNKVPGADKIQGVGGSPGADAGPSQSERMNALRTQALARLDALQQQDASLDSQLLKARGDQRNALLQQQEQVEGGIELQKAMVDALAKINQLSSAQVQTGLAGEIDRLQRSAPELLSKPIKTPAPPVLESLTAVGEAGVTTQASVLFQLLGALRTIDQQTKAIDQLSKQSKQLRSPFIKVLRATIAQGQELSQRTVDLQATPTSDAQDLLATRKQFDTLTTTFQVLAASMLPFSQEGVLLDNARGTLTTWHATVDAEYKMILRSLLIRVVIIAVALGILAIVNRVLNRAAVRYVSDLRRRRQLLLLRRITIGFLTGLVLIFGFVTQFSSLATFAGFITAGIAVGLQSVLLSVAAYFFIVGRYGIRVGDRITVAGVTGEVIEVGLVRFYLMELVGTGTEMHSTGRVAVFANSVLFQTGTPLYKQMPGTEYAWHELTAKLSGSAEVEPVTTALVGIVKKVYAAYCEKIEAQHREVETWMGAALPTPKVESRLELAGGGLSVAILFPVELAAAAEADQQVASAVWAAMQVDGPLKSGVTEAPIIKAAVKS